MVAHGRFHGVCLGVGSLYERLRELVSAGNVQVSLHGYRRLAEDGLSVREVLSGFETSMVVEEYPRYHRGPCVLLLERDARGRPVHAVWGIPKEASSPAVLVRATGPIRVGGAVTT